MRSGSLSVKHSLSLPFRFRDVMRALICVRPRPRSLTQELFEVTSCYFPITFTAPRDDPHGVSGEELVLALRDCLASNAALAPLVFRLLLEKLDATGENVKVSAQRTLRAVLAQLLLTGSSASCIHSWTAFTRWLRACGATVLRRARRSCLRSGTA